MRSAADGGSAPELAVLARSPHRCLLSHPGAMAGVKTDLAPPATPRQLGYRMPAEWEPHAATWLAWPHQRTDWPGKFAPIPWVYGEIIRTLARYEAVNLVVSDELTATEAGRVLQRVRADSRRVRPWQMSTNRSWVRDSGPIFVSDPDRRKTALDWQFNAWAKYPDWEIDDQLAGAVASELGVPAVRPDFD